ncbi:MAG: stage II sporulation protein M, partial [Paraclostridium sp.]|uniref:stage II sporulation protein M n=1 Tax=Paraclostridium sp. TaxID=2023273 RepID=UPI003F2DF025
MKRINKRNTVDKISKEIIFISCLFLACVIVGSLLNKIFPQYTDVMNENIAYTANYYNSDVSLKDVIILNLKMDSVFLIGMAITTLSVILSPIAIILFAVKGLSIGYTINSFVIAMKLSSFKILLITLIKFMIVLPG